MKAYKLALLYVTLLLLTAAAIGCRSVHKDIQKSTVDSTARTEVRARKTAGSDSTRITNTQDSTHTEAQSEYERETVIEDYAIGNTDSISNNSSNRALTGSNILRRTTIREKGKATVVTTDVRSQSDSARLITTSNFDSTAASEVVRHAESKTKEVARKPDPVAVWNWLLLLLILAVVIYAFYHYKL